MSTPTDLDIARAQALGRAAGRGCLPMRPPYPLEQRALRARWALAYAEEWAGLRPAVAAVKAWWGR